MATSAKTLDYDATPRKKRPIFARLSIVFAAAAFLCIPISRALPHACHNDVLGVGGLLAMCGALAGALSLCIAETPRATAILGVAGSAICGILLPSLACA